MTPEAHHAAAIEILDTILSGVAAEQALTRWARGNRFAGSKDRAAIRDIVFQGERRRASAAAMGSAEPGTITGRAIVIGLLRQAGQDPDAVFGAGGYAPSARPPGEQGADWADLPPEVQADLQPWMFDRLARDHPDQAGVIGAALRDRAPVFIRANLARTTRAALAEALGSEFGVVPHPHCATALEITVNARRLTQHAAWRDGLFELQDAASQMAVASISDVVGGDAVAGDLAGMRVLDYCAGGGGKALALAAQGAQVTAHDADPARMADIAPRAARAKAQIKTVTAPKGTFDLVVVDAPCSGSGTWRRAPGPKWTLTAADLLDYQALQRDILEAAWTHVRPGGTLAYMTCSVFAQENGDQRTWCASALPGAQPGEGTQRLPDALGDGFYHVAIHRG